MIRNARTIGCPECGKRHTLVPAETETYEQLYRAVAIEHERKGCLHRGYAAWEYDPEWEDNTPQMKRHENKVKLVQHPDGYLYTVPGEWSADQVALHNERTRTSKRRT